MISWYPTVFRTAVWFNRLSEWIYLFRKLSLCYVSRLPPPPCNPSFEIFESRFGILFTLSEWNKFIQSVCSLIHAYSHIHTHTHTHVNIDPEDHSLSQPTGDPWMTTMHDILMFWRTVAVRTSELSKETPHPTPNPNPTYTKWALLTAMVFQFNVCCVEFLKTHCFLFFAHSHDRLTTYCLISLLFDSFSQ